MFGSFSSSEWHRGFFAIIMVVVGKPFSMRDLERASARYIQDIRMIDWEEMNTYCFSPLHSLVPVCLQLKGARVLLLSQGTTPKVYVEVVSIDAGEDVMSVRSEVVEIDSLTQVALLPNNRSESLDGDCLMSEVVDGVRRAIKIRGECRKTKLDDLAEHGVQMIVVELRNLLGDDLGGDSNALRVERSDSIDSNLGIRTGLLEAFGDIALTLEDGAEPSNGNLCWLSWHLGMGIASSQASTMDFECDLSQHCQRMKTWKAEEIQTSVPPIS